NLTLDGHECKECVYHSSRGKSITRIYGGKQRLYVLTVAGKDVQSEGDDVRRFFDSFHVLPSTVVERGTIDAGDCSSLTFTPDGQTLISAGNNGVKYWSTGTGREMGRLPVQGPVAVSRDGKHLTTTSGGFVQLRDAATRRLRRQRFACTKVK